MSSVAVEAQAPSPRPRRLRRTFWFRFKKHKTGLFALTVLAILYLIAFIGPLFYTISPTTTDPLHTMAGPSAQHWLGTDELGRDELARILQGGRVDLAVGLVSMLVAMSVGILVGGLAGFYRGWVEVALMRFVDTFMAIPPFFLILAELAVFGTNPLVVIIVVGLSYWGQIARTVFAEVIKVRQAEFIDASMALGVSNSRIMLRHILPQILPPALVLGTLVIAWSILTAAALSYLGLGIQPPLASWGNMLQNAQTYIFIDPYLAILPGLVLGITVLSFNLLGNALRDILDPKS